MVRPRQEYLTTEHKSKVCKSLNYNRDNELPVFASRSALDTNASVSNHRLSRARGLVENLFGIMTQARRIYRRPLNVTQEHA